MGYVRVSTQEQGDSGAGLEAQRDAITREAAHKQWTLKHIYQDVASGATREKRPQLEAAIHAVNSKQADTLVVAKLDRLSRSSVDFGSLVEESRRGGWSIVILDLGVDLATPAGEMVASIMAVLAQWERRMISERTIAALRALKQGGVVLGRPVGTTQETEGAILTLRETGHGLRAIARHLNELGVPTPQGAAEWRASSVRSILRRLDAEQADSVP